jgi:uncharacterized membrane protein YphA (DoxX/SURF4 family)
MNSVLLFAAYNPKCNGGFLFFPPWYKYLTVSDYPSCVPQITHLTDIWLIVAAVIEILLRVAAIVAVIFIIYAGFGYTTSQGDPEGTGRAKSTLINALIGLAVAVSAAGIVSFIANSITQ